MPISCWQIRTAVESVWLNAKVKPSKISDSDRTTALQAMGYPVVLMTYGQLADFDAFRVVMELIMSYLDVPLKDKTPRQQELERRLREEIFIDWAGM